jgi:formiminotetrahydrofolate cyclodeaminase
MVKTAAQRATRQIRTATTERRPNLSNGGSVRALSTASSATLASMAATDAVERNLP